MIGKNITTINDLRNVGFEIGAVEGYDRTEHVSYTYDRVIEVPAGVLVVLVDGQPVDLAAATLTFVQNGADVADVSVLTLLSLALGAPVRTFVTDAADAAPDGWASVEPMNDDAEQEAAEQAAEAWANSWQE